MGFWKNFFVGLGFFLLLIFFIPIHIKRDLPLELENNFTDFIQQFNKSYDNETVYQHRFQAFRQSIDAINNLNANRTHNLSAIYGLTKYSDMTPEEFRNKYLQADLYERISSRNSKESKERTDFKKHRNKRKIENLPLKVDWREKGLVTEVNNQKWCGACWAFSTIENMETMHAINTGKLVKLSVQQLIDCAGYNNDGCKGGDSCTLMEWMRDYDVKVQTEEEYPLRLVNGECKTAHNDSVGVKIDKFACDRLTNDEDIILATLAQVGPVAVAINAATWQNYLGGVIQFHCSGLSKYLNHAVQIVGYDLSAEIPHYIVRNSWGKDFGNKGYLYIAIGENLCGLANEVSALTVL